MGWKRRTFVTSVLGLGTWAALDKKGETPVNNKKPDAASAQSSPEQAEKNQSVLDPIYSVDKLIIEDEKDPATGFTRPKIIEDKSTKIEAELTVNGKGDENDNKIFMVANNKNQNIKPKGGYNKIFVMPPLNFGKKTIDSSGAGLPAYNELTNDSKILAYYTGHDCYARQ